MIQIIPAILATTPEDYQRDIEKLNDSESFKEEGWVHIDFMDGKFVNNKSLDPEIIEQYPTHLKKEAHLMVEEPWRWIKKMVDLKFDRVIIHLESDNERGIKDALADLEDANVESGLAVNPGTPVDGLKEHVNNINLVLIMGVVPGFQGQPFEENTYERIKQISQFFENISVDGAVKDENSAKLVQSGAKVLVSGSFILNGNIDEQVEKLWEAINK